jgi:ribosome maturation factor RimP
LLPDPTDGTQSRSFISLRGRGGPSATFFFGASRFPVLRFRSSFVWPSFSLRAVVTFHFVAIVPRTPLHQRLISIVEPVCQAAGYELVELRFALEQGGWTLRVAVDRPLSEHIDPDEVPSDRVDLAACENLSRELSAVLDVEDPIPQAFLLEVSSPGIDRPLRTTEHFRYFSGSEAKIQLATPLQLPSGERRNFKGILRGADGDQVVIECDGTRFRLPLDEIDHARLVPDWDAVMKGRRGVAKPVDKIEGKPIKPGHRPSRKSPQHRVSAGESGDDADKER